ncbi:transferase [Acidianus brierleyi]|uniref:Transferase n=1 Tax=Acidianus brierleyi TaxID=41673 RepID=A0A2U9IB85_9CREN|nr:transferase [Acidianus brierleyi]AWR93281.1 transferase [Acidianus brierleyi]
MEAKPSGKIPIEGKVWLDGKEVESKLFLHVRGYNRARVTHIDIEGEKIRGLIRPRHSVYPEVEWKDKVEIPIYDHILILEIPEIKLEFKGNLYVGGKGKGIFLGFHRDQIKILEEIAKQKGVIPPLKKTNTKV